MIKIEVVLIHQGLEDVLEGITKLSTTQWKGKVIYG